MFFLLIENYEEIIIPTEIYAYNDYSYDYIMYEDTYDVQLQSAYSHSIGRGQENIRKLTLPSKFKRIPKYFCYGMINLEEFNCSDISYIGYGAFENCVSLETFNIPNSVDSICGYAFYNCVKLKNINLTQYMSEGEYYNINVIPNSVKYLGFSAFRNCQSLKAIRLSDNLTGIDHGVFANCPYLERVEFQYADSIGERAFEGCINLPSITIPSECKSIGTAAFCMCINLSEITIPNSVISLGDYAFQYCVSLEKINVSWNNPISASHNVFENSGTWWWFVPETYSNRYYYGWPQELKNSVQTKTHEYEPNHIYNHVKLNIVDVSHLPYKETEPWCNFLSLYSHAGAIEPIDTENTVNTDNLNGQDLSDNVVDDIYYNIGDDNYDSSDGSIIIKETTNMGQISDATPGSADVVNNFTGLILQVGAGKGTITVNVKTVGNAQLAVQIGNQTPTIATRTEQGDIVVNYDVSENTFIYIYAIIASSDAPSLRASSTDMVKIYSIKVTPGATGINSMHHSQCTIDNYYTLDGQKQDGIPTKKGVYIVNGRKVVIK